MIAVKEIMTKVLAHRSEKLSDVPIFELTPGSLDFNFSSLRHWIGLVT